MAGPALTRIDRYVGRQLAVSLVAVTGGLVALTWLTQSLRFVELVVNRGLSLRVFLELTGLLIPSFVAVILPITSFVVVQFVYQRLAGDRELTVMRATGMSQWTVARPALGLALATALACWLLNLVIVPASVSAFREFQFEIRNRVAAFLLQDGVFTAISDDLTVFIRTRDPDGTLHGIMIDDTRQKSAEATILAESGRIAVDGVVPRVLLTNGSRQEIDRATGRLNILTFAENTVDLSQADRTELRYRDATEMSLGELLDPPPGLVAERDRPRLRAEAHHRMSGPLTAVSFIGVALFVVLSGGFRRHGGLLRPAAGVVTVVALLATGLAIHNLAARDSRLIPLIWLNAVAPGLLCYWLLFVPGWSAPGRQLGPTAPSIGATR